MEFPSDWQRFDQLFFEARIETVPKHIVEKGLAYMASRLGEEFVAEYLRYLPQRSRGVFPADSLIPAGYTLQFALSIPDRPFVDRELMLRLDVEGRCSQEPRGVPFCAKWPQECDFAIDEDAAKRIAREVGLPPGTREWRAKFHWDRKSGYVWSVSSSEEQPSGGRGGYKVVIDANTGLRISGPARWGPAPDGDE
jgi:hypothetical protein